LNEIDQIVGETLGAFNRIDILVNNAAVVPVAYLMDATEDHWDQMMSVNAKGSFFLMQRVAKVLISQGEGGRIVNIGSIAGKGYFPINVAYAASKGAVIAMTKSAANLLAREGINVNSVCPGRTETPLNKANWAARAKERGITLEEMNNEKMASIPTGKMNEPEDIAEMVVFLCGPGSKNITGQAINVDGGVAMH
jgi:NAD(P)-dependent dehydrogenase (short-subunit alcohol dehydrogenase family)